MIALPVLAVVLFVNISPQMGKTPSGEYLEKLAVSQQHNGKVFVNPIPTSVDWGWRTMKDAMYDYMNAKRNSPKDTFPSDFQDFQQASADSELYFTWFGHSALYLEMEGKKILIDPMLGSHSSPVPIFTPRFKFKQEIPLDKIPAVDAVIYSHDHYDHLDYGSVKALDSRVGHYYVPLGVGGHLRSWGVAPEKITEMDWNQSADLDGIELVCTPARHFSGRGLTNKMTTLWASWAIKGSHRKVYFSGDGGYGKHFKEIGEQHGPFDLAFIECGQYNEAWSDIHMLPDESAQAGEDVNAKSVMPIHWGAFSLSPHDWDDPIIKFKSLSEAKGLKVVHPIVGERVGIPNAQAGNKWWANLN